jgi:transcriptional regulator with XRE-family HTH domain
MDVDSVPARIKRRREAVGMTQVSLAHAIGVAPMTVSKWERDRMEPGATNLRALADVLNCTLDWLIAGRGEPPPPPAETLEESGSGATTGEAA